MIWYQLSNIFVTVFTGKEIAEIRESGTLLSKKSSFATMTAGSFFHNLSNQKLYLWPVGSDNPNSNGKFYTAAIWFGYSDGPANFPIQGQDIAPYLPIIDTANTPPFTQAITELFTGDTTFQYGSVKLNDPGYWFDITNKFSFENASFFVKFGESASYSDYATAACGQINKITISESGVEFQTTDMRTAVYNTIPPGRFLKEDGFPYLDENIHFNPRPVLVGQKWGIPANCVDTVNLKYEVSQTVFDFGSFSLESIDAVYLGENTISPTDYTVDMANGQFTILAQEFYFNLGALARVVYPTQYNMQAEIQDELGDTYIIGVKIINATSRVYELDDPIHCNGQALMILSIIVETTEINPAWYTLQEYAYQFTLLSEKYVNQGGMLIGFTPTGDPILVSENIITCDAKGLQISRDFSTQNWTSLFSENIADITFFMLALQGITPDLIDESSFVQLQDVAAGLHCADWIDVEVDFLSKLKELQTTGLFHLLPDQNRKLSISMYSKTGPIEEEIGMEVIGQLTVSSDASSLLTKVLLRYDRQPASETTETDGGETLADFSFYPHTQSQAGQKYNIDRMRNFKTILNNEQDARTVADIIGGLYSTPPKFATFQTNKDAIAWQLLKRIGITYYHLTPTGTNYIFQSTPFIILQKAVSWNNAVTITAIADQKTATGQYWIDETNNIWIDESGNRWIS